MMLGKACSGFASRKIMLATVLGVLVLCVLSSLETVTFGHYAPSVCVKARDVIAIPLLWVTEAGNSSKVAQKRMQHLKEQSVAHGIRLRIISQIPTQGDEDIETQYNVTNQLLLNKLDAAGAACLEASLGNVQEPLHEGLDSFRVVADNAEQFVLISQDDVHFHREFVRELTCTLGELPTSWRSLHLCPGYLWGRARAFFTYPEAGMMNPEGYVPPSKYSRLFRGVLGTIALGGPMAFIIRCGRVQEMVFSIKDMLAGKSSQHHDDVTLQRVSTQDDYVARNPQLCVEWTQGGSEFMNSTANHALLPKLFEFVLFVCYLLGIGFVLLLVCICMSSLEYCCPCCGAGGKAT